MRQPGADVCTSDGVIEDANLTSLAQDLGYADQAHFTTKNTQFLNRETVLVSR